MSPQSEQPRVLSNEGTRVLIFLSIAIAVVTPSLLIFSTDDLFIFVDTGLKGRFSVSQAAEGRYTFAALCQIIRMLGFSTNSYLLLSSLTFCASLAIIFNDVCKVLHIDDTLAQISGFLGFVTFGFNFDLYQFAFAQLSYSIAFFSLAFALRIAVRSDFSFLKRIAICSAIGGIAIGSYQIYSVMAPILAVILLIALQLNRRNIYARRNAAFIILVSVVLSSFLYFVTNWVLHAAHAPGYAAYPRREQGLRFILPNLEKFWMTLWDLLSLTDQNLYSPLLPLTIKLAIFVALALLCLKGGLTLRSRFIIFGLILITLVLWANPVNILLSSYWPSARSMASFSLFVGATIALLMQEAALETDQTMRRKAISTLTLVFIVCEGVNGMLRFRDRYIRQSEDLALAQSIVSNVLQRSQGSDVVRITIGATQSAWSRNSPNVLDYGRSLFQTSWSMPALIDYVSNGRILAQYDKVDECRERYANDIIVDQQDDSMIVCVKYQ